MLHFRREQIEPIGEGPQYNPDGYANVETSLHGRENKYTISADDFRSHQSQRTSSHRNAEQQDIQHQRQEQHDQLQQRRRKINDFE